MKRISNLERPTTLGFLNKVPFFRAFTPAERARIVDSNATFYVIEEGECIIRQGSHDTSFYVLMTGEAFVLLDGQDEPVATISPGDFFGEIAFLLETPRTSNVIANKRSIALGIDRALLNMLSAGVREKIKDQIIEKLVKVVAKGNNVQLL